MKTTSKYLIAVFAIILAIIIRYAHFKGHLLLLIIEIPLVILTLMLIGVAIYNSIINYKKQKKEWESQGNKILIYNQITDISGIHGLQPKTLHNWLDWIVEHKTEVKVAQAFVDILKKVVNSPSGPDFSEATRQEAQVMLYKLDAHANTKKVEPIKPS